MDCMMGCPRVWAPHHAAARIEGRQPPEADFLARSRNERSRVLSRARRAQHPGMVAQEAPPFKLEPGCESLGCACDLGAECLRRDVPPGRDLNDVRARSLGAAPGVDPAQLVLGALQVVLSLVLELEQEFQLCPQAEFLLQAAPDGVVHILAQAWMRAAGVRPVARPQGFALRALLQDRKSV